MIGKVDNYLILKSKETNEEHLARIVEVEKEEKKIKLVLIDEYKNVFFRRNRNVDVLIPANQDLYTFSSPILYFDILERIMTIEYPKEINMLHRRKHKRFEIKIALDAFIGETQIESFSYDISLGGISFVTYTDKLFSVGDYIKLLIKTKKLGGVELWVEVMNQRPININGKRYFLNGGQFDEINERELELLTIFLYENDVKLH